MSQLCEVASDSMLAGWHSAQVMYMKLTWGRNRSVSSRRWTKPAGDEAAFLGAWGLQVFRGLDRWLWLDCRWSHPANRCRGRWRGRRGHRRWLREPLGGDRGLRGAGTGASCGGPTGRDDGGLGAWGGTLAVGWTRRAIAFTARLQVLQETAEITRKLVINEWFTKVNVNISVNKCLSVKLSQTQRDCDVVN